MQNKRKYLICHCHCLIQLCVRAAARGRKRRTKSSGSRNETRQILCKPVLFGWGTPRRDTQFWTRSKARPRAIFNKRARPPHPRCSLCFGSAWLEPSPCFVAASVCANRRLAVLVAWVIKGNHRIVRLGSGSKLPFSSALTALTFRYRPPSRPISENGKRWRV